MLLFQTDHAWSPRTNTNINADTVMIYGLDDLTVDRIRSRRAHGQLSPNRNLRGRKSFPESPAYPIFET